MESHQDFRSLQAKFQASQPEPGELPRKPPKPGINRVPKKPPQPEFTSLKKSLPPEFTSLKKPPQPEPNKQPQKPPQPDSAVLPPKPPKPELSALPKSPQPETAPYPRKALQAEAGEAARASLPEPSTLAPHSPARPPSEPKPGVPPKFQPPESCEGPAKSLQAESGAFPRKVLQAQASGLPRKSMPQQQELCEVPQTPPWKPRSPKPDFSAFPKKPPKPQASGLQKSLLEVELGQVPQTPPWRPASEAREPHTHSPQPGFSAWPKRPLQLGDLTRTSSEPEVSVLPERPAQKALQPHAGGLPRTASEPRFSSLPRKFPERQGLPRKSSQPEPGGLPRRPWQPQFSRGLSRKPLLPSSASEGSLPTTSSDSGPRFRITGTPRWSAEDLKGHTLPRQRPLPPASSLGPPPAKPPLPPGPIDIQSFWSLAAATSLRRTPLPAPQRRDTLQGPDEIYELYDHDTEPMEEPSPNPRGAVQCTLAATRRQPQDQALRKGPQPQPQPQPQPPMDPKLLKQMRKAEKAEREFRKKFKFEGEIVVHTRMMIDPNAKPRRGGGKHLGVRRGEILEVLEFTSKEEVLCRDPKGKYGYVPRAALLPLETEVYDDVSFWDPLENQPFPQG